MVTGGRALARESVATIVGSGWDVFGRRRRATARTERAGWPGRYVSPEGPGCDWSHCRVLDVSTGGAGLELLGPAAEIGHRIVVDLPHVRSTSAPVTDTGEVHQAKRVPTGLRVGVRFVEVGELERALLRRLVARQKHEQRHGAVVVPFSPPY
jgi:hypothetical protein